MVAAVVFVLRAVMVVRHGPRQGVSRLDAPLWSCKLGDMRTLMLLRHAKSSWDDPDLGDHERPLNKRGTRDASRMGALIADLELTPDVVLCSDAVRARATLTLVLSALGGEAPQVNVEPRLYLAEPAAIMELVRALPAECRRCLVVAHNPGIHSLALEMTGSGERKAVAALAVKFPTGALAVIDLDADTWRGTRPGTGRLRRFAQPKEL